MVFNIQFSAVFFQPVATFFVVRQDGGHHIPEIPGVIHVCNMAKLVYDYIVQYF